MYIGKGAVAAAIAVVMLGVMGYLAVALSQANADLAQANKTIDLRQDTIENMTRSNASLRQTLDEANANVERGNAEIAKADAEIKQGNATIEVRNAAIEELHTRVEEANAQIEIGNAEIAKAQANINELAASNRKWESDYTEQAAFLTTARAQVATLETRNNGLQSDLRSVREQYNASVAALASLRTQRDRLVAAAGDDAQVIAVLSERIDAMEKRILELAGRRAPLILGYRDTVRSGFVGSGSMYPAFTKMDEATWLVDFDPADIVVGTTISFDATSCWDDSTYDFDVAHRVLAIEVRDGMYYFWPRGDHNPEADGCWVPEHHVDSYMIEIHKNVFPAHAELQGLVIAAKDKLNEARAAYYELYDQYCQDRDRPEACTVPAHIHTRLVALGEAWDAAGVVYDCWVGVAVDSRYPGHIPRRC